MNRSRPSAFLVAALATVGFVASANAQEKQHVSHSGNAAKIYAPTHFYGGAAGLNVPHYFSHPNMYSAGNVLQAEQIHRHQEAARLQKGENEPLIKSQAMQQAEIEEQARARRDYDWRRDYDGRRDYDRYNVQWAYPYYYPYRNLEFGIYGRPYYYGYLIGVPYMTADNYSPAYYFNYNQLPNSTGMVTTSGNNVYADNIEPPVVSVDQAQQLLSKAEGELASGQYQVAIKDAGQAAHELHEDSSVHEVLWLSLMGLGDYRGAAIEAHAISHFGVTPSWNDVAMKYEQQTAFATQLTKLEDFAKRNQDSDFAVFLLGYDYLVLGHRDAAKQWLEKAQKMDPEDQICNKLVASLAADPSGVPKPAPGISPVAIR